MAIRFQVTPLTPTLGAEISGLDINRLDDATFAALYQTWLEFKVVFLRDQSLELAQLEYFSLRFGELMQLPYVKPLAGHPHIIRVLKEADEIDMGVFGGDWHSDFSFLPAPPKASILYAEQVPPVGGDTLWIDMVKALATLPEDLRSALQQRDAIHIGAPYGVSHAPEESTRFKGSIEIERNNPEADRETRHPAICRHPETGQQMLFINPTYTSRIDGYSAADSSALLARIYQHCSRPEFSCRFNWSAGSLALWDNRNTLHYAVNDYDGYRRCLYRTTIRGEAPLKA
ncbi:MAG: TauD/TfdA family dioxygenase [Gammaproteobacteria bacterium]|nr:MAG: TauD/TfdA family dioxygenase [Gammaproteobacteria bacterium]